LGGGGGGGGANGGGVGAQGGSGVVIIAYTTADFSGFTYSGTSTTGTNGSETWVKMTTSGDLVLTGAASANSNFLMFM